MTSPSSESNNSLSAPATATQFICNQYNFYHGSTYNVTCAHDRCEYNSPCCSHFLFYHQVMCLTNQVYCSLALCIQATAIMKPGDSYLCGCMILFCILFTEILEGDFFFFFAYLWAEKLKKILI